MTSLETLQNTTRPYKRYKRVGRGWGSSRGKTCCRGSKGSGSRAGYKRRYGYEGGQMRMFTKMPIRGFSNARFRTEYETVNLGQIDSAFSNGDIVNPHTLAERGLVSSPSCRVKLLGNGDLTKNVQIEIESLSHSAREKLQKASISVTPPKG